MWAERCWSKARRTKEQEIQRVEVKTKRVPQRKMQLLHKNFFSGTNSPFYFCALNTCTSPHFLLGKTKMLAVKLNQRSSELCSACINSFWCCLSLCPAFSAETDLLELRMSQNCVSKIQCHFSNIFSHFCH